MYDNDNNDNNNTIITIADYMEITIFRTHLKYFFYFKKKNVIRNLIF